MNYYEHHLGDYLRDTAHLSMIEDGAYRRLLDQYYIREQPLPADLRECCKLARAVTKAERDAVAYVLGSFFEKTETGYRQPRADVEISHYSSKSSKARDSANARWSRRRPHTDGNADAMRTHSEGICDGNAPQSPIPNPQLIPPNPRKRGRLAMVGLPEGFTLTADLSAYVTKHIPDTDPEALFGNFTTQAAAKGWKYIDWDKAFQTYVRNVAPNSGHWSSGQYPRKSNGIDPREWR